MEAGMKWNESFRALTTQTNAVMVTYFDPVRLLGQKNVFKDDKTTAFEWFQ